MQATTYDGYFKDDQFYTSGKVMRIPEKRRVIITILEDAQIADSDKLAAWNEFKQMAQESVHENDLLAHDAFKRNNSGRELVDLPE